MVIARYFLILVSFFSTLSAAVKVTVELVDNPVMEGKPIVGVIKITHDKDAAVEASSFKLKGDPLKVEWVNDLKAKDSSIISSYRFQLKPESRGLYYIPNIRFKVAGKDYSSTPFTYTVAAAEGYTPMPSAPLPNANPSLGVNIGNTSRGSATSVQGSSLQLQAFVQDGQTLYPGQRAKFVYRYTYTGSIVLTKEDLPLLEAKGFKKIGEKEIKDTEKGPTTVTEISQTVEAQTPGDFSFGPSTVEGLAYSLTPSGQRTFFQPPLSSEAPAVSVKVVAFPEEGKPKSFNNAIGNYTMKAQLLSPAKLEVGDILTLSLEFSGKGDLSSLPLPELCCQPGFSGKFKLSDLPPIGLVRENSKFFVVDLRPLSSSIKEVPPIEFSSFDPDSRKYVVVHSEPIPIQVTGTDIPQATALPASPNWQQPSASPRPVDAPTQPITTYDVEEKSYGRWWLLLLIPIGLAVIYLQMRKRPPVDMESTEDRPIRKGETQKKKSVDIFLEALKVRNQPANFYALMTRAFLFGLFEKKWIQTPDMAPEELPDIGISKEVRDFLFILDEIRFSRPTEQVSQNFVEQARQLFTQLQQSQPNEG